MKMEQIKMEIIKVKAHIKFNIGLKIVILVH